MRVLSSPLSRSCPGFSTRSPHGFVLVVFLFLYLLVVQYCRTHYFRDPTSVFFDPNRGYEPIYTRFRTAQAADFIRHVDATASSESKNALPSDRKSSLCVGIASIARNEVSYVETAVGSLLVDLTEQEREDIHLILFIPHTDPSKHPSFSSRWLSAVADKVLYYDVDGEKFDHIRKLETEGGLLREKGLFDYTYLLKACQSAGTPYVLILEDDVLAMEGWYHRTKQALYDVEQQTRALGASKHLYLRLFYTQQFLGWNSEDWFTYLVCSIVTVASVWGTLILARRYVPQMNRLLSREVIFVLCFICTPLAIILFFCAGRVSMLPIPPGVHQMPRFGCCSQALVFPHERVGDVIAWYESKRVGFADSLLEEFADQNNEIRWALTPSVFQHIGAISSKAGTDSAARLIWNFPFELNDPISLQVEHDAVIRSANNTAG
ncbi:hypothetical protein VTO42DRAFT_7707 [Malbranchea cinnamomea]